MPTCGVFGRASPPEASGETGASGARSENLARRTTPWTGVGRAQEC
ncbi:MAG: hypothetical protein AAFQ43_00175 [Bacteroidota bacterium]